MDKKGIELEMLGYWIIAIIVLVIVLLGIFILSGKGQGAIDYVQRLFRFGK